MDKNEMKALIAETMAEMQGQAPQPSATQQVQQLGNLPVVGQVTGGVGALISGVFKTAGSVVEGVGHVAGTASDSLGEVGRQLKR